MHYAIYLFGCFCLVVAAFTIAAFFIFKGDENNNAVHTNSIKWFDKQGQ